MNCPNCGRKIRSTNQCAYCGYIFNDQEKAELEGKNEPKKEKEFHFTPEPEAETEPTYYYEEEILPRSRRRNVGSVIWNIIKVFLLIALLFVSFLFGPHLYEYGVQKLGHWRGKDQVEEIAVTESEEATEAELKPAVVQAKVDNSAYPKLKLTFQLENEDLVTINNETFNFAYKTNGKDLPLENYSLFKVDKTYEISFNDPTFGESPATDSAIVVMVPAAGLTETVSVDAPNLKVDPDIFSQYRTITQDYLGQEASYSLAIRTVAEEQPYVLKNETIEAGDLAIWYVLAYVYQAIDQKAIAADDVVALSQVSLVDPDAEEDEEAEEGEPTVASLIHQIVADHDTEAMNALVSALGGASEFNSWLRQNDYFATKLTGDLTQQASGRMGGMVTSVLDTNNLLYKLARAEQISAEALEDLKEELLNTPLTSKYPEAGVEGVVAKRYEIATLDQAAGQQVYAAIFELEDGDDVVVALSVVPSESNVAVSDNEDGEDDESEEAAEDLTESSINDKIADILYNLAFFIRDGKQPEEERAADTPAETPAPAPAPAPAPEPTYTPQEPAYTPDYSQSQGPGGVMGEINAGNYYYENGGNGTASSIYLTNYGYSVPIEWHGEEGQRWFQPAQ